MRTRIALVTALGATTIFTTTVLLPAARADGQPSRTVVDATASMPSELVDWTSPQSEPATPVLADAALTRAAGLLSPPPPPPQPAVAPVSPPAQPADTVTPDQRAAWERVALCEEGGNWHANGPRFSGGLGISRSNWIAFGGEAYASEAALASEDQQIMVAERIQAEPPDQNGCRGW